PFGEAVELRDEVVLRLEQRDQGDDPERRSDHPEEDVLEAQDPAPAPQLDDPGEREVHQAEEDQPALARSRMLTPADEPGPVRDQPDRDTERRQTRGDDRESEERVREQPG